jgi:hypothetical protein
MRKLRVKSGDKFNHKFYGEVEVISAPHPTVTFRKKDGSMDTQHLNYFLIHCGKIEMDVYVPAFSDTIFRLKENKFNYKLA